MIDRLLVRALCSKPCADRLTASRSTAPRPRARWRERGVLTAGVVLLLTMTSFGSSELFPPQPHAPPRASAPMVTAPEPVYLGPPWPPTEQDWQMALAADLWVHPLDGPNRRMPVSDSRVFGAERPGDRPVECKSGHCGVDLSGPWGEPIRAVHDGVIDRVQRGPNEEHGGHYVRLAHRDGTVITQYFHLAAIPRHIVVGHAVRLGEVIGLLGDTGVHHSGPHLHFAISVKPSSHLPERYIDPEPLIALWPLRVELKDGVGMLTAQAAPGVPRGASSRQARKHVHHAAATASAEADEVLPLAD